MNRSNISTNNFKEILKNIVNDYSQTILEDIPRLNALIMDYAPDMSKDRKLIIRSLEEGVIPLIDREINKNSLSLDLVFQKAKKMLISELFITENAAQNVVETIFYSKGYLSQLEIESNPSVIERQLLKGENTLSGPIITEKELMSFSSIGYKAFFYNERIKEVYLPSNIKRIYPKAFFGCFNLKKISFPDNLETIGHDLFSYCFNLEDVKITNNTNFTVKNNLLIDKKRKAVIRYLKGETSCVIGYGLEILQNGSFRGTFVESIKIPSTILKIEKEAISNSPNLVEINVDGSNAHYRSINGVLHTKNLRLLVKYPQGKKDVAYYIEERVEKIEDKAFSNSQYLKTITVPSSVKIIGEKAFEYCSGLKNLLLPRGVENIEEGAFRFCSSLKSISLPQGITKVKDYTFANCTSLENLNLPLSVEEIGNMAFFNCQSLRKVYLQSNIRYIGNNAFDGCPQIEFIIQKNEYIISYCKKHKLKYSLQK